MVAGAHLFVNFLLLRTRYSSDWAFARTEAPSPALRRQDFFLREREGEKERPERRKKKKEVEEGRRKRRRENKN